MDNMDIVELRGISKEYGNGTGDNVVKALDSVSLNIKKAAFNAVTGTSGSGKSTLLHIIGGLDAATSGSVVYNTGDGNIDITGLGEDGLAEFRQRNVGFVFQSFNLIPMLTVYENIIFPVQLSNGVIDFQYVDEIINRLALDDKRNSYPNKLSGGQQQRVAIARAVVSKPVLLLADEPTGNLDKNNSWQVVDLLRMATKEYKQTVVMVTHDDRIAGQCDRVIHIEDGRIVEDVANVF